MLQPKPTDDERPRPIIAKLHHDRDKDLILRLSRDNAPLYYKGKQVHTFPDYTAEVASKCRAFGPVLKVLKEAGCLVLFAFLQDCELNTRTPHRFSIHQKKHENMQTLYLTNDFSLVILIYCAVALAWLGRIDKLFNFILDSIWVWRYLFLCLVFCQQLGRAIETFFPTAYWVSPFVLFCFFSFCSATFLVMGEFCRFSWGNGGGWVMMGCTALYLLQCFLPSLICYWWDLSSMTKVMLIVLLGGPMSHLYLGMLEVWDTRLKEAKYLLILSLALPILFFCKRLTLDTLEWSSNSKKFSIASVCSCFADRLLQSVPVCCTAVLLRGLRL